MVTTIGALHVNSTGWTIKARVTSKSTIREWSNIKGEGSFFTIELLDSSKTTIRGTFFREAVDEFFPRVEVGNIYTFSGGRVKIANKKYNSCKSNCEIIFDLNSMIRLDVEASSPKPTASPVSQAALTPPLSVDREASKSPISIQKKAYKGSTKGGVISRGVWGKENSQSVTKRRDGNNRRAASLPVTPVPDTTKPVYDTRISDAERAKLRADRAAAAEARLKKQQLSGTKRKEQSPLKSPQSASLRMRWTVTPK